MIAINKNVKGWRVYLENTDGTAGKLIDIVFFDGTMKAEEVRRSLIDHDNFPGNIMVLKDRGI
jgi:hypothetical protein